MSGAASMRATARLLLVCAALIGLFMMHGLPGQSSARAVAAPAMAMAPTPADTSPQDGSPFSVTGSTGSGHGGVCVSDARAAQWETGRIRGLFASY